VKILQYLISWLRNDIDEESVLQDVVQHSPNYVKKTRLKFQQTEHGFIEVQEQTDNINKEKNK